MRPRWLERGTADKWKDVLVFKPRPAPRAGGGGGDALPWARLGTRSARALARLGAPPLPTVARTRVPTVHSLPGAKPTHAHARAAERAPRGRFEELLASPGHLNDILVRGPF